MGLSPFLKSGFTVETSRQSGKTPVYSDYGYGLMVN